VYTDDKHIAAVVHVTFNHQQSKTQLALVRLRLPAFLQGFVGSRISKRLFGPSNGALNSCGKRSRSTGRRSR
jgi:hypothetical protein